jgi:hypothetical protein
LKGPLVDKCSISWNANFKESNESFRFWFSSQSFKKNEKKPSDLGCKVEKVGVSKDVGARENGVKTQVVQKYSFTHLKTKMWKRCL